MTVPMRCSNLSILRVLIPNGHGVVNFLLLLLHALPYATAQTPSPPPPPDSFSYMGPKFNGTMAIVTVILVSVFFIVGFFSVYIRQCNERRLRRNNPDAFATIIRGGGLLSRRGARGLDDSVISTFPTFLYSAVKELKIGKGILECAVCLNEFEDDETLRLIPKCSHVFHMDCIDAWLSAHNTCPVCRANLVPQPGETPLSFAPILNSDGDSGSGQPEQISDYNIQEISQSDQQRGDEEAPIVNLTNQNRPPRSRSTGWRLTGWFPRSHSTGHSLVQPGLDCERFTLRLPAEVRSQLMNSSLNRSKSCVAFPRARSSRRGFRSGSGGFVLGRNHNFYERFGRPSRSGNWGLSLTPPFISRTDSVRTPRTTGDGLEVSCMPSKSLFNTVNSSFEDDRKGERSSDRLRPDNQV